jgi:hypothetical protein
MQLLHTRARITVGIVLTFRQLSSNGWLVIHRHHGARHHDHRTQTCFHIHAHVEGTQVITSHCRHTVTSIPQLAHLYSIQHENWAISTSSLVATAAATAAYVHDPIHESYLGFRPVRFARNPITRSTLTPCWRAVTLEAGTTTQDGCRNFR